MADVICLAPAVQGSIIAAVQRYDPAAIVIIDGAFQSEPAVRHKEILWAISQSIPVIGAASMGALRAAELYPYMHGVGLIYRWYRRFAFLPDDAVAVLHGPREVNFSPLTHALVDLRMTIRSALRRNLISADLSGKLENAARNLNFRERTLSRMVREALPAASDHGTEACRQILAEAFVQQKKRDALSALKFARDRIVIPRKLENFRMTVTFAQDLEDAGLTI
ncbi:TfuA-like protein [Mesorhizobium sp. LHD-90]|uniref:TfuA-like protein n=1 Tax=Mesorhizobium sp. LHD-90 TaxID=3071414 RepID=UPI0027E1D07E|nr:TfuA-like protein [Mesorhizobium sp. LHD-90]MDQ6436584.1 TfuA-like protein [Mesorhizobium sp. LHD-90]